MTDEMFRVMTGQMLEYLTPRLLARDLGVTVADILCWDVGSSIPEEPARTKFYEMMRTHSIWNYNG